MVKKWQLSMFSLLAVFVLVGAGCTTTSTTTETTTPVAVAEVADAPAGCVDSNSLVVMSDEVGVEKPAHANSYLTQWGEGTDSARLIFADYTVDPADLYSDITGENMLVVIDLLNVDESPIDVGTYSYAVEAEKSAWQFNVSTADLAGGVFDDLATVELTYVGPDYACGTITANDGYSSINGSFIAKYRDMYL